MLSDRGRTSWQRVRSIAVALAAACTLFTPHPAAAFEFRPGQWQDTEYGWAVVIKDDFAVFPFNKVLKHLTEGDGDSVLGLFTSIPAMLGHANPTTSTEPIVPERKASAPPPAEPPAPAEPAEIKRASVMSKLGSLFRRR